MAFGVYEWLKRKGLLRETVRLFSFFSCHKNSFMAKAIMRPKQEFFKFMACILLFVYLVKDPIPIGSKGLRSGLFETDDKISRFADTIFVNFGLKSTDQCHFIDPFNIKEFIADAETLLERRGDVFFKPNIIYTCCVSGKRQHQDRQNDKKS